MLIAALFGATFAFGNGMSDPDARAAAVEKQLSDAERFQLLHGLMALPFPTASSPPIPQGVKLTAGYIPGIARLGIPDILESDASLGVVNPLQLRPGDVATAMPSGLALASTFDADLAYQGGAMIGAEARAKGFNVLLGGSVDLTRDPRNGRNFEYLGEDPLLAGTLAGAAIAGTQSQGVVSTVKHFALNDQETLRQTLDARIDEPGLRESDLLAFELAIERGQPGSVMCAYNKLNGDYACGNDYLLNRTLKSDWGFKGWVMSDWGAVHDVSYFMKGLDQQSGAQLDAKVWFDAPLKAEVAAGRVPKQRVSDAVHRILRTLYAVGADWPTSQSAIDYAAHARVARQVADQGIVLLKNDGLLPLTDYAGKILVVGGHADLGVLSGGGSSQVTPYGGAPILIPIGAPGLLGPFARALYMPSSPLQSLRSALPNAKIDFESGYDLESAMASAAHVDSVIVFATQWQTEGYDHASMELPEGQDALIRAVTNANANVIVVLETGNPVTMPWLTRVRAVLEAWYPGEQGGAAVAEVLSGAVNPSGHLPISFPVDESQLPRPIIPGLGFTEGSPVSVNYPEGAQVGYRWYASQDWKPLFAFGFGLSYTRFEFTRLQIHKGKGGDRSVTASFTIKNIGARAGAAVPQLYMVSAAGKPLHRLVAFSRLALDPGQSRVVRVALDPRLLAHWDSTQHRWQVDAGRYGFALGSSAGELGERMELELSGWSLKP
jgi:beta-glucosidase